MTEYCDQVVDGVTRVIDLVNAALARATAGVNRVIDLVNAAVACATAGSVRDLPSAHTAAVELVRSLSVGGLRVSGSCGGAPFDVGVADAASAA